MKRFLLIILLFACALSLFASNVFLKDIGFSFGHGNFLFDKHDDSGVGLLLGVPIGLTEKLELDVEAMMMMTPRFGGDFSIGFELSYALLGERVFDYDNAGIGINTLISIGLFANNHNPQKRFLPTVITLRVSPLTVGSPRVGRRERILPIGVAYNFHTNEFSLFLSAFIFDYYHVHVK